MWCIALLCGIPYIILGRSEYAGWDGYLHIFIAQQSEWSKFWQDVYANAHPPLFFLLLRGALHFGRSLLIYRSVSIVCAILSVYLAGRIARKITGSDIRGYQTALAFGLALPSILIACEVRQYALNTLFILWSFYYFLDVVRPREQTGHTPKARFFFTIFAILACLSHYSAFFYCGATLAALAGRYFFRVFKNGTAGWLRGMLAELATALPITAVILTLYALHANILARIQGHLLPYYLDPAGPESLPVFLFRNWRSFVNLFSPIAVSGSLAVALLIAVLAIGAVVAKSKFENDPSTGASTRWTLLVTMLIIVQLAAFGVAGKYPFGGDLRQQYVAFPFLVLTGAIFLEVAAKRIGGVTRLPISPRLANAAIVVAVVAISLVSFQRHPRFTGANWIEAFQKFAPESQAVYLDQVSLITFFISYDDWDWSYAAANVAPGIDLYNLERDGQKMIVFRDTMEWVVDVDQPGVYEKLAACLRTTGVNEVAVFASHHSESKPASEAAQSIRSLAAKAGICPVRLQVTPTEWHGVFQAPACSPENPAQ